MAEKHDINQQADELLDRALSRYAGEPLAGLEGRTLARVGARVGARVRAREEAAAADFFSRTKWTRTLAVLSASAAAVAASLVIGIQVGQHRENAMWQARVANATGVWNSVKAPGTVNVNPGPTPTAVKVIACRKAAARQATPQLAKSGQFPSPAPLTQQERVLAHLVATADPALLSSLAQVTRPSRISFPDSQDQNDSQEPRPPQLQK